MSATMERAPAQASKKLSDDTVPFTKLDSDLVAKANDSAGKRIDEFVASIVESVGGLFDRL